MEEIKGIRQVPKTLCIQVGTNDVRRNPVADVENTWKTLVRMCMEKMPQSHIIVGSIPPVKDPAMCSLISTLNKAMGHFCGHNNVTFVNNDNIAMCENPYAHDGVHLTKDSFFKLANNITLPILHMNQ